MFLFSVCFVRDSFIQHILIVERLTYYNACKLLIYSREQDNHQQKLVSSCYTSNSLSNLFRCVLQLSYSCIDLYCYNKNLICKIPIFLFTFLNLIDVNAHMYVILIIMITDNKKKWLLNGPLFYFQLLGSFVFVLKVCNLMVSNREQNN